MKALERENRELRQANEIIMPKAKATEYARAPLGRGRIPRRAHGSEMCGTCPNILVVRVVRLRSVSL